MLAPLLLVYALSNNRVKRTDDQTIRNRINTVGYLNFSQVVVPLAATERESLHWILYLNNFNNICFQRIACFFVFDKEASADLNNYIDLANAYATQLALLASKYTIIIKIFLSSYNILHFSFLSYLPKILSPFRCKNYRIFGFSSPWRV